MLPIILVLIIFMIKKQTKNKILNKLKKQFNNYKNCNNFKKYFRFSYSKFIVLLLLIQISTSQMCTKDTSWYFIRSSAITNKVPANLITQI